MKFGFGHVPSHVGDSTELVQRAEALGFDFAWIPDQQLFCDPYVTLASMALSTSRIRLAVGVTNPFTRHPAITARAIATVDQLSGGRAALGMGAGNMKELVHPLKLDSSRVGDKCLEAAQLMKQLWRGGAVDFHGTQFTVDHIGMDIPTRPDLPVYLAGRGPKILSAAGEVADGAIIGSIACDAGLDYAMGRIRAGAEKAGRDVTDLDVVSWVTVHITDDVPAALDALRPSIGHLIGGAPLEVLQTMGLTDAVIQGVKDAYAVGGQRATAPYVTDEAIRAFTIVGDPGMVAGHVDALAARGITQISLLMPPGTVADYGGILERFAREVRPRLHC